MYNIYRKKIKQIEDCILKYESGFITDGTSSTIIHIFRNNLDKDAALIINEKEGPDTVIVFTYKENNLVDELIKSDYFSWKNNVYFVFEDVDIVRETKYKKQKAYQCNVSFKHEEKDYYGYFISSLAKYTDTTLTNDLLIIDNEKPVLIMPYYDWLQTGIKLYIKGMAWKIVDFDLITNDGIAYISLDRAFIDNQIDGIEEPDLNFIKAGVEQKIETNFAYFKSSVPVEIISKTSKLIKFIVPFGVNEIVITTKNLNKEDIILNYKVVN